MAIDVFIFNDELDLLDLRFGQLSDTVDHFVVVEADKTFTGRKKPLHLRDNMSRFAQYAHKIKRVEISLPACGPWDAEKRHREAIVEGVKSLNQERDTIMTFSDCDEIPNPVVIKNYNPVWGLNNLKQYTFYYNFNHLFNYGDRSWSRARIGTVGNLLDFGSDEFRGGRRDMDPTYPFQDNGGWHCSYFGSNLQRIRAKVNAFSHDDMAPIINQKSDRQLAENVANGVDLFNRSGIPNATYSPTDAEFLPPYFLANREKFKLFTNDYFVEAHKELLGQ